MPDYWCYLSVLTFKWKTKRWENWELQRPEAGVETDLEIAQSNCGANHNWCIRNCLERYRKVVHRDWCHIVFTLGDTTNVCILLAIVLSSNQSQVRLCHLLAGICIVLEIRNKKQTDLTGQRNPAGSCNPFLSLLLVTKLLWTMINQWIIKKQSVGWLWSTTDT